MTWVVERVYEECEKVGVCYCWVRAVHAQAMSIKAVSNTRERYTVVSLLTFSELPTRPSSPREPTVPLRRLARHSLRARATTQSLADHLSRSTPRTLPSAIRVRV